MAEITSIITLIHQITSIIPVYVAGNITDYFMLVENGDYRLLENGDYKILG
tara:strand:- start:57 stop:209 length:153 start_codon:yes stop_codon:yes gene_type:complete